MDNLQLEVKGSLNGHLKYDRTYTLSATAPTFINFNFLNVDRVDLITSGGTPHDYPGFAPGEQFAMDNLTINLTIPEPAPAALFAFGSAILALNFRKRKCS